jgi:hypothetical protein
MNRSWILGVWVVSLAAGVATWWALFAWFGLAVLAAAVVALALCAAIAGSTQFDGHDSVNERGEVRGRMQ